MPRPADTPRHRYWVDAAVDRASAIGPVTRLRQRRIASRAPRSPDAAPDGLPLPPAELRVLVDNNGDPVRFIQRGADAAQMIRETVEEAGSDLDSFGAILDFGCGCGRVTRHWSRLGGPRVHACDYNPRLVGWVDRNLPFVEARLNNLEPPAPYESEGFDLVYAISILTHLPEGVAKAWIAEWTRILKPGGLLFVSVHGDLLSDQLGRRQRPRYEAGETVVRNAHLPGTNACVAFHPHEYMTNELLGDVELLSFRPASDPAGFSQDVYLARAPRTGAEAPGRG